jgi:hypothetical protein
MKRVMGSKGAGHEEYRRQLDFFLMKMMENAAKMR